MTCEQKWYIGDGKVLIYYIEVVAKLENISRQKVLLEHKQLFEKSRTSLIECEIKRLDLEDNEFWGKAYLPPERTIEIPGSYEGKAVFLHVSTNEPLLGCGPLPDWLRKKQCIYGVDGKEERTANLYIWRCFAIYTRIECDHERENVLTKKALRLAREYYENDKLKRKRCKSYKTNGF